MATATSAGSLSAFFGFDPNSQYAELFSQIYHLTKVPNVQSKTGSCDEDLEDMEDGEIDENDVDDKGRDKNIIENNDGDPGELKPPNNHLTCDDDFQPPIGQHSPAEGQLQPLFNWKEDWMRISRDTISWNQAKNQNQNMPSNSWNKQMQVPPPQFQQLLGTNQPNNSVFQGTNQINSSIFTSGNKNVSSLPSPPPQLQLPSWNRYETSFFLPSSSQGFTFPGLVGNSNPFNFPPPPIDQAHARGGKVPKVSPGEKEMLESKGFELRRQFDIDDNPARKNWLIKYMEFQASRGTPLTNCPAMYREPLDLYKFYHAVMEEGGYSNCSARRAWKNVCLKMTSNHKPPLWSWLQKQYRKLLLQFENFETGRPEDLSKTEEESDRPDMGERKVLRPLPVGSAIGGGVGGQQRGGGYVGAEWGALSASYNKEEAGQESGRGGGGVKKGKKKRGKKVSQ